MLSLVSLSLLALERMTCITSSSHCALSVMRHAGACRHAHLANALSSRAAPHCPPLALAQTWQDEQRLLVGTKCNKLLQWDTATGALRNVPLPPAPPRAHRVVDSVWGSCGIHSVAVNPAGDMVATGGTEPADAAVLSLPSFKPVQTLVVRLGAGRGRCAWCPSMLVPLVPVCLPPVVAQGVAWGQRPACKHARPPACTPARPPARQPRVIWWSVSLPACRGAPRACAPLRLACFRTARG